jgi:hypothetical protein
MHQADHPPYIPLKKRITTGLSAIRSGVSTALTAVSKYVPDKFDPDVTYYEEKEYPKYTPYQRDELDTDQETRRKYNELHDRLDELSEKALAIEHLKSEMDQIIMSMRVTPSKQEMETFYSELANFYYNLFEITDGYYFISTRGKHEPKCLPIDLIIKIIVITRQLENYVLQIQDKNTSSQPTDQVPEYVKRIFNSEFNRKLSIGDFTTPTLNDTRDFIQTEIVEKYIHQLDSTPCGYEIGADRKFVSVPYMSKIITMNMQYFVGSIEYRWDNPYVLRLLSRQGEIENIKKEIENIIHGINQANENKTLKSIYDGYRFQEAYDNARKGYPRYNGRGKSKKQKQRKSKKQNKTKKSKKQRKSRKQIKTKK